MTFYFVVRFFRFSIKKKGRTDGRAASPRRERERGAYEGILNSRGCRDWSPLNSTQPSTHTHKIRTEGGGGEGEEETKNRGGPSLFSKKRISSAPSEHQGHGATAKRASPPSLFRFFFYFTTSASFFLHLGADNTHTHTHRHTKEARGGFFLLLLHLLLLLFLRLLFPAFYFFTSVGMRRRGHHQTIPFPPLTSLRPSVPLDCAQPSRKTRRRWTK